MTAVHVKFHSALIGALVLASIADPPSGFSQGTMFTFQGHLTDGGNPANGNYDMQFLLWDAPGAGGTVGPTNTVAALPVSSGLFTVALGFGGGAFTGDSRWLEIGVRTNGSPAPYSVLSPRQPVTPAPYAITASALSGMVSASQVAGTLPLASLPSAVVTNGSSPMLNGANITNVAATVPAGVLTNGQIGTISFADTSGLMISTNSKPFMLGNGQWWSTAVPFVRPAGTGGIALDIMPNGPDTATWIDVCSSDVTTNSNWEGLHFEKNQYLGLIGCNALGSGTIRDLRLQPYGGNLWIGYGLEVVANQGAVQEIPAGPMVWAQSTNLSLVPGVGTGVKIAILYNRMSDGLWYSALEVTNPAAGAGTLQLMKSGGTVAAGGALAVASSGVFGDTLSATNGFLRQTRTSPAASVVVGLTDSIIYLSGSGQSATLPDAAAVKSGWTVTMKQTGSGAAMINTASSQTIDGATSYLLSAQWKAVTLASDGANWFVITTY